MSTPATAHGAVPIDGGSDLPDLEAGSMGVDVERTASSVRSDALLSEIDLSEEAVYRSTAAGARAGLTAADFRGPPMLARQRAVSNGVGLTEE